MRRHVLLYGMPHVGKTTTLLRVVEGLSRPAYGFHTAPLWDGPRRIGLEAVTHNGQHIAVALVRPSIGPMVGKYWIDVPALDGLVQTVWPETFKGLAYADEIGRLTCQSTVFTTRLGKLFETGTVLAITARKGHALIRGLQNHPDVQFIEIRSDNRDSLVPELIDHLRRVTGRRE